MTRDVYNPLFHDTPVFALVKVNEIFNDPVFWWNQTEIQRAIDQFYFRFARISDNWLDEWKKPEKLSQFAEV